MTNPDLRTGSRLAAFALVCGSVALAGGVAIAARARTPDATGQGSVAPAPPATFDLFFLGHDIGHESDVMTNAADGRHLEADVEFTDRGTAIQLKGSLDLAADGAPRHLLVKGRNYRLFSSDSEVAIDGGHAHVRDLMHERDLDLGGKPFFPIDNYAPIGVQEQLIQYWLAHKRPAEIAAAPSGPIHISSRGRIQDANPQAGGARLEWERLAIDGPVWGRETAWITATGQLDALTTWAGALPFEAARPAVAWRMSRFQAEAVKDRIDDLAALTTATPPAQKTRYALVGATVIDGTGAAPMTDATIVIRDGAIVAVGPRSTTTVPSGFATVDMRGKYILPGLWDMHAHASQTDWAPVYLASGVTTIRDMGGEEGFLVAIRDAIDAGRAFGPRYLLAGLVDGPGPHAFGAVVAGTPAEAVAITDRYHDEHFQEMKIYSDVKADVVRAVTAEAHRLGMTVTGHVPTDIGSAQGVVDAGFDGIAHMQLRGVSGSDASKAQIAFFAAHHTVMDPTQSWNELSGRPAATPLDSILPGVSRLPLPLARMFASMSAGNGDPQAAHARLVDSVKLLKDAVDAGLLVVAGTDKGVPGFSLQREIELYVEGGMTPMQAIQTATIMPARAMRIESEVGTIAAGKRADLVILSGDPLADIHNIRSAIDVVAKGALYPCDALWRAAGYGPI